MSDGTTMVPLLSTGEIIQLRPEVAAIKAAKDDVLGVWYATNYKAVMETFGMVKEEILARIERRKGSVLVLSNGQTLEVKTTPYRECNADGLRKVQENIKKKYGQDIELVRVKTEEKPDMRNIKKARKLSAAVTKAINKNITETKGNPKLEVTGLTKEAQKAAFSRE